MTSRRIAHFYAYLDHADCVFLISNIFTCIWSGAISKPNQRLTAQNQQFRTIIATCGSGRAISGLSFEGFWLHFFSLCSCILLYYWMIVINEILTMIFYYEFIIGVISWDLTTLSLRQIAYADHVGCGFLFIELILTVYAFFWLQYRF